jgi:hypothetical protein
MDVVGNHFPYQSHLGLLDYCCKVKGIGCGIDWELANINVQGKWINDECLNGKIRLDG